MAEPQDDAQASTAPKLAMEEGMLDFREPALTLHNKARTPAAKSYQDFGPCALSRLHAVSWLLATADFAAVTGWLYEALIETGGLRRERWANHAGVPSTALS